MTVLSEEERAEIRTGVIPGCEDAQIFYKAAEFLRRARLLLDEVDMLKGALAQERRWNVNLLLRIAEALLKSLRTSPDAHPARRSRDHRARE